ncbi:MAG TPA: diphosphomevalonate decarboxylase [Anaerolineae bacterium]|nr:diphosphomevalonate decarboxylase [Anaerolineae bacterium]
MKFTATASAHPNIAFIKYWGNRDDNPHLPANSSLSMNLEGLTTTTTVCFDERLKSDVLILNKEGITGEGFQRVHKFLNHIRQLASKSTYAQLESVNNFPTGAGLASSASAYAALALAATRALGLELTEKELSRLARRGSGSACRSVPAGFVEWQAGEDDSDSYAFSIASPEHWGLVDCIALVNRSHKKFSSWQGHRLAATSPLQSARVKDCQRRLRLCKEAILEKDFKKFAEVVELDSNLLHAVMMSSQPALLYWEPATIEIMKAVIYWRETGLAVCYTLDAGPNVHVICRSSLKDETKERLLNLRGVKDVIAAKPGGGVKLIE